MDWDCAKIWGTFLFYMGQNQPKPLQVTNSNRSTAAMGDDFLKYGCYLVFRLHRGIWTGSHKFWIFCYSGNWPSSLTDLLSRRLVGAVGAGMNIRSSYTQHCDLDANPGTHGCKPSVFNDFPVMDNWDFDQKLVTHCWWTQTRLT